MGTELRSDQLAARSEVSLHRQLLYDHGRATCPDQGIYAWKRLNRRAAEQQTLGRSAVDHSIVAGYKVRDDSINRLGFCLSHAPRPEQ